MQEAPDRPLLDGIIDNLREKRILLVLDNCEHLIQACALLAERLLGECPESKSILATSREALRVPGERAVPLPTLSIAKPGLDPPTEAAYPAFTGSCQSVLSACCGCSR